MNQTVLITGTSSGIGKAAAKIFQEKGWNVIASVRKHNEQNELAKLDRVLVTELDVTRQETIDATIEQGINTFGKIDLVVNNAGFGMMGTLEASSEELMQHIFNVNVFGVARVTKAILPHMRTNRSGTIINVSSIVGRAAFPYQALYHATKHALEGLTDASQYELKPLGVTLKLVEPGGVATEFINNISLAGSGEIEDYQPGMDKYMATIQNMMGNLSTSESIAQVVYEAATDGTEQLRYLAGPDAEQIMAAREQMDDKAFYEMMAGQFGLLA